MTPTSSLRTYPAFEDGACGRCTTRHCCTAQPAVVMTSDLAALAKDQRFRHHYAAVEALHRAKALPPAACACPLFDHDLGTCKIYEVRPIDCRLFPLDLVMRDDEYWWVRYQLEACEMAATLTERHVLQAEDLIRRLSPEAIRRYALEPVVPAYRQIMTFIRPLRKG